MLLQSAKMIGAGAATIGLAGTGAAGHQDVLSLAHCGAQESRLTLSKHAIAHIVFQRNYPHRPLAQGKGRGR